jgi:TolB-like protein
MSKPSHAIFLSYASQDADAAARLAGALRAAGAEVWFDRSELRGGAAWDASIRRQIRECALFVPVISAATEARSEGYFRREWNLAVDRMLDIADDRPFLLPVAVDGTPQATARVPDRFRERQWSRVVDDEAAADWAAHVAELLGGVTPAPPVGRIRPSLAPAAPRAPRGWIPVAAGLVALLVAAAGGIAIWKSRDAGMTADTARAPKAATTAPPATATASPAAALDPKSIAVLPFANLSGRPEDAYLADGLQEEVLNALARVRDLKVISRTSTLEYRGKTVIVREIGQRLNVGTVLEGSVRREGNTLRLTVQLIDANNDRHLFAANYDRDMAKLLQLQSAVARQVAEALSATLTKGERGEMDRVGTNNGDAYDRYLKAVALFRRPAPNDEDGIVEPRRLLEEATRLDPDYADAQALLSRVHTWAYFFGRRAEDGTAARKAYERALAIDPKLADAQLARGMYAMYVTTDIDQALADLSAALQSRPNSAEAHQVLGFALRRRGRMQEALEHFERAADLDPLNETYGESPVVTLIALRRWPEALARIDVNRRRFPNDLRRDAWRAWVEAQSRNDTEPLRAALRTLGPKLDRSTRSELESEIAQKEGRYLDAIPLEDALDDQDPLKRNVSKGLFYHAAGDRVRAEKSVRDAARNGLERLQRNPALIEMADFSPWLAVAQSMLGEHAAAIATIDAARVAMPESRDAINGPYVSFVRSIVLVRAGRGEEGYAEVDRLLRVPFGSPTGIIYKGAPILLLVKDDPRYDEIVRRPPRL